MAPPPVAARADGPVPTALEEEGIERIISCFVEAARRAAAAGYDAVEIHGAHGYLVSQFLSPLSNRRTDRGGGALENRARFLREVLARTRAAAPSLAAYCRLGVADEEPGGLNMAEGIAVAGLLARDGVPLLHASSGIGNPPKMPPDGSPYSDRMRLAVEVRKAVGIPVIGVGGIRRPEEADGLLARGARGVRSRCVGTAACAGTSAAPSVARPGWQRADSYPGRRAARTSGSTERSVVAPRMSSPPSRARGPGTSPSRRNTHTGLKIGSIIEIRNDCTAVTCRTP